MTDPGAGKAVLSLDVVGMNFKKFLVCLYRRSIFAVGVKHLGHTQVQKRILTAETLCVGIGCRSLGVLSQQSVTLAHLECDLASERTLLTVELVIDFAIGLGCVKILATGHLLVSDRQLCSATGNKRCSHDEHENIVDNLVHLVVLLIL